MLSRAEPSQPDSRPRTHARSPCLPPLPSLPHAHCRCPHSFTNPFDSEPPHRTLDLITTRDVGATRLSRSSVWKPAWYLLPGMALSARVGPVWGRVGYGTRYPVAATLPRHPCPIWQRCPAESVMNQRNAFKAE